MVGAGLPVCLPANFLSSRRGKRIFPKVTRVQRFLLYTASLLLLLLTAAPCAAADGGVVAGDSTRADTVALGRAAVVRGVRTDGSAAEAGQRLEGEALRRMSSYSVADAVRFFSGVQLKDYGGIGGLKTINVRSMGSEHTAVSYDGVEITNAQNGVVDLGRLSLAGVGAIALTQGGMGGSLLRPARSWAGASAVEIVARRPEFRAGEKPWRLRADVAGGSFGTFTPEAMWEQRLGASGGTSLRVNAAWLTSTGRYKYRYHMDGGYDTTAMRRNGDITILRGEAALFGSLPRGGWRARGYVYSSRRGLPGAVVRGRLSHIDRQRDVNSFVQGSADMNLGKYSLKATAKMAYDYMHYLYDSRRDQGAMYVSNHYHQSGLYISTAHRYAFSPRVAASLAADYSLDALTADMRNFASPLRHSAYISLAAEARPGAGVELQASALTTCIDNCPRNHGGGRRATHTAFSPGAMAVWRPGRWLPGVALRAFYKRTYRVPTFNDLYYTFIGNANLKPETATQVDVGASWSAKPGAGVELLVKVDGYANRVTDKIVAVPAANQFRWTMSNIGRVRVHGLDASASAKARVAARAEVSLKATYTYQRAMDCSDKASPYYKGQVAYIPKNSASAVAAVEWGAWSANYSLLYTGPRYDSSANVAANSIRSYYISDVALSRELKLPRAGVEMRLSLAVNNILDRHYDVVRCYPMPGRNYKITLSTNI